METAFQQTMGSSSAAYKRAHGGAQCNEQQAKLLTETLEKNSRGCIIVCSWMEITAQRLLRSFAATNPVVHIVRDLEPIQQHLRINDREKMQNLLAVSNAIFRSCTNFEFFNISETDSSSESHPSKPDRLPSPYLTLKGAERHFLKFLSQIFPPNAIPFIEAAFILSTIPTEQRLFTYALSLSMADVLDKRLDLEEFTTGADAVQIVVPPLPEGGSPDMHANLGFELASDITRAIASVRRSTVIPIVAHIALPARLDEEIKALYIGLISHTFRSAPEMVTLDLRLDDHELLPLLDARGRSKVICDYSFTNINGAPSWSSPVWETTFKRAVRLGSDLVRFLRPASCLEDNFDVANLRARLESLGGHQVPLIAYNTGALGRNSACFNPILTLVERDQADVPARNSGMLSARAASLALSASFIYDPMKLYVFGANVSYSMSPAMHNAALTACGMPHRYQPYSTDTMSGLRHLIEDPNFGGASVGLPFKVEIISLTHSLSKHARAIGAVNTLIPVRQLDHNGSVPQGAQLVKTINRAGPVKALFGENTDWIGIRACIRRGLSPANAVRQGTCGFVIGAGGMARAALYAMLQVGVQNIAIYNRTVSRAEQFANHFQQLLQKDDFQFLGAGRQTKIKIVQSLNEPWPSDFNLPTIIISCIPTHRIGDAAAPDFRLPEKWLGSRSGGVIFELGYKTLDTPLLAQAKSRAAQGWVAMDGLDLLPDQGFAQFELFTGRRAPRRIMRRDLLKAYADAHGKQEREEMGPRFGSINEPEA